MAKYGVKTSLKFRLTTLNSSWITTNLIVAFGLLFFGSNVTSMRDIAQLFPNAILKNTYGQAGYPA